MAEGHIQSDGLPADLMPKYIRRLTDAFGGFGPETKPATEALTFLCEDGQEIGLEERVFRAIDACRESVPDGLDQFDGTSSDMINEIKRMGDYDVIDLDGANDNSNAIYVKTSDDLRDVLIHVYNILGLSEGLFRERGLRRDDFIESIVAHEEDHADCARSLGILSVRFRVVVVPSHEDMHREGEYADLEAIVQTDLGGRISKLHYAAIVLSPADPTLEDYRALRHIFGYSSEREVIARIKQHNYAGRQPQLPLPKWYTQG